MVPAADGSLEGNRGRHLMVYKHDLVISNYQNEPSFKKVFINSNYLFLSF